MFSQATRIASTTSILNTSVFAMVTSPAFTGSSSMPEPVEMKWRFLVGALTGFTRMFENSGSLANGTAQVTLL